MCDHGEKVLEIRPASLSKEMFAQPERKRPEKFAPGSRGRRLLGGPLEVRRDRLKFVMQATREYGDAPSTTAFAQDGRSKIQAKPGTSLRETTPSMKLGYAFEIVVTVPDLRQSLQL
jgi:hypothetical protein